MSAWNHECMIEEQWECPECGFQNFGDTCARCLRYRDEED